MKTGLALVLLFTFAALFAPYLATHDPQQIELSQSLRPPSSQHYLGTDSNGADLYSEIIFGSRLSLEISIAVVIISTSLGLVLGSLAGFYGGSVDLILMRIIDMFYAFPGFLLALAIIAFLGPSVNHLILALCITGWTSYARLVRGEILNIMTKDFIVACRAMGAPADRIIFRHLWPNLFSLLTVQMSFGFAGVIISESGLSFLGLGPSPREASWGVLLGTGRKYLTQAPHVSLFPGIAILLLVLGFNLIGESLRKERNHS